MFRLLFGHIYHVLECILVFTCCGMLGSWTCAPSISFGFLRIVGCLSSCFTVGAPVFRPVCFREFSLILSWTCPTIC